MIDNDVKFELRREQGKVQVRLAEAEDWVPVRIIQLRPLSERQSLISLMHADKKQELLLLDIDKPLPESVRELIDEQLQASYFIAKVSSILSMQTKFGSYYLRLATDHGEKNIVMTTPARNVVWVSANHCIVCDIDGNYYEIADTTQLDAASQGYIRNAF